MLLTYKKHDIIFAENQEESDLYLVKSGKVMVFTTKLTKIIPLSTIEPDEFLGEFSFIDNNKRSSNAICLVETTLLKIPQKSKESIPPWLIELSKSIIERIRNTNEVIKQKGIVDHKNNVETLSIEMERLYNKKLQEYTKSTQVS